MLKGNFETVELELGIRAHGDETAVLHPDLRRGFLGRTDGVALVDGIAFLQGMSNATRIYNPHVPIDKLDTAGDGGQSCPRINN